MESKLDVQHANWKVRPTKPSRRWTSPPPPLPATCTICGDVFVEENFWEEDSTIISYNIPLLSVIATLVCGHLYHVECLDVFIPSDRKCDPPCPLCEALEQRKNEVSVGEEFLETKTVERKNSEGKEKDGEKSSVQVSTEDKSLDKEKEMKKLSKPNQAHVEEKSLDKQVERKKTTECSTTKVEGSELDSSSNSETTKRPQLYMTRARARARAQSVSSGKKSDNDRSER